MKSFDFDAVTYDGEIYCTSCFQEDDDVNLDSPEVGPIFADQEWDYYPVCCVCGEEHDYVSLTSYGAKERYLRSEPKAIRDMRMENGQLPAFAWPGGYPIIYQEAGDSAPICPDCANKKTGNDDPVSSFYIHHEGPPDCCDLCNCEIESAYGDPEAVDA